jgi:hypothetical protein
MFLGPTSHFKESPNPISSPSSLQKNLDLRIFQTLSTQEHEKRVPKES